MYATHIAEPESASANRGEVAYPLLLECDFHGQVLWMSERSRLALGAAENLIDTIKAGTRSRVDARMPAAVTLRFSGVLTTGDRVWIGVQAAEPAESASHEGVAGLLH